MPPWLPLVSWSPLPLGSPPALALLARGVLARDARCDLDAALVQVLLYLLIVLPAEAEAVRARDVLLRVDLVGHPRLVRALVLAPHLPLAGVVLEGRLADHRDTFLRGADRLAHAAAAARFHVGVVQAVGRHVEAGVGALDPAERALDALVEVDDRAHGARRVFLEVRVALRDVALAALHGLAHRDGRNGHAFAHLPPLRLLEGERRLGVALGDLDRTRLEPVVGLARRRRLELGAPLRLLDRRADRVERQKAGLELGQGAQDARLGVILLVDPEAGEGGLGRNESQVVRRVLLVNVLEQRRRCLERGHEDGAVRDRQPIDGLKPVPGPGLDALAEGVVDADGDVDFLGLVARHVLLELLLGVGDDRKVFGGDAVALGAVAVAAERYAPSARLAGRQHDAAADARREVLLEDAAVDDLTREMRHRSS